MIGMDGWMDGAVSDMECVAASWIDQGRDRETPFPSRCDVDAGATVLFLF